MYITRSAVGIDCLIDCAKCFQFCFVCLCNICGMRVSLIYTLLVVELNE